MAGTIIVDRIESDASYASNINVASQVTFSNTVNFGATGQRITGDFSNATVANRVMLQSSTGTFTDIGALAPSSSTQSSAWTAYLGNDPTNTSRTRMLTTSLDSRFEASITGTGTYQPMTFYTGGSERMRLDTSGNPIFTNAFDKIFSITASVASNALTVTLNPCALDFRSSTLTSGTIVTRTVTSAISVTVSSGSTLGTVSAQQSRIVVLAIDNAGTVELAVVNISGGNQLDETNLISTTAEGGAGAADSASVIYSTTARTSVAYRVIGFIQSTQATAGTWATAPSTIQGKGGQALAAMSSLAYGQTWQNVTGSRAASTTYYNTTGKPIYVSITGSATSAASTFSATLNGVSDILRGSIGSNTLNSDLSIQFIVPPSGTYLLGTRNGGSTIGTWYELR